MEEIFTREGEGGDIHQRRGGEISTREGEGGDIHQRRRGKGYTAEKEREEISTIEGEGGDIHRGRGGQGYQDICRLVRKGAYKKGNILEGSRLRTDRQAGKQGEG